MLAEKLTADDVRRHCPPNTPSHEVERFATACNQLGLHPEARQIMMGAQRKRENGQWLTVYHVMPTVDGLRVWAEQTGEIDGYDGPYFYDKQGKLTEVWQPGSYPVAAKVVVHRRNRRAGFPGLAHWDEYAPMHKDKDGVERLSMMWGKMPSHMLAKCAEALALRRAFPKDLSNLYTHEEMQQALSQPSFTSPTLPSPVATPIEPAGPQEPDAAEVVGRFWSWYNEAPREPKLAAQQATKALAHLTGDEYDEFLRSLEEAGYYIHADAVTVLHESQLGDDSGS